MTSEATSTSYRKALFFLIVLVAVLFIGTCLLKIIKSPVRPARAIFGSEQPLGVPFQENQKDSVQGAMAGKWVSNGAIEAGDSFMRVTDKIEFKPNGIYWRVFSRTILLPSGDSGSYTIASTGYASPYGRTNSSPDTVSFQIHFIGATILCGPDTCYLEIHRPDPSASILPQLQARPKPGEGVVDTVWSLVDHGSYVSLGNFRYSRYGGSNVDTESFFPVGSVENINKFSLGTCDRQSSFELYVKQLLAKEFGAHSISERTAATVAAAAETYYQRFFAVALARRVTVYGTGKASISFSVNASGCVVGPVHSKSSPWNMKLDKALNEEAQTWKFPPCPSQTGLVSASINFSY